MNRSKVVNTIVFGIVAGALALPDLHAAGKPAIIKGYVLDSACAFVKDLEKPISRDCALACAKAGSPLVILTGDGKIYWPISGEIPAAGQNSRLLDYAGGRVTVQGKVYERSGTRAIVIEKVEAATDSK